MFLRFLERRVELFLRLFYQNTAASDSEYKTTMFVHNDVNWNNLPIDKLSYEEDSHLSVGLTRNLLFKMEIVWNEHIIWNFFL